MQKEHEPVRDQRWTSTEDDTKLEEHPDVARTLLSF